MDKEKVIIYTDGACSGNPGPGGWGAILMYKEARKEISGGIKETTNNIMEMTAVIEALKCLKVESEVEVYSDSAYTVDTFNKGWIYNWMKKGWKKANGDPVKNKELWIELYELTQKHKVKFIKVKGHADNEFNNRCDEMARNAIETI
ncbi:MAG: ribonuclease HI [Clostridia bacterium]|nr:ribonuclease HI [Clostridia bacterium]